MPQKFCWLDDGWVDSHYEECEACDLCKAHRQRDAALETVKGKPE